jgi:hypothetical protein
MPKVEPIQNSFSAGELSPLMRARSDQEIYRNGLSLMINMLPNSRGPAQRRPGSRFLASYDGNNGRVFSLQSATGILFILSFLENIAYIATLGGPIPQENYITEPRFENQGTAWTVDKSAVGSIVRFEPSDCYLFRGANASYFASIAQQWTPVTPTNLHQVIVYSNGTTTYRIRIGNALNDGSILDVTTSAISFTADFTPGIAAPWITITVDSASTPDDTGINISYVGVTDSADDLSFATPYLEADLTDLQTIQAPSESAVYVVHPKYAVYKFGYDDATNQFSFVQVTFTGPPTEWTGQNWPSTGAFYQGRLWLGGTPQQPETFWGSKSGVAEDFTQGANADDGLEFTLEKFGQIQWMSATKNLVIGTEFNEFIITSETGVITPSDVQATQQSAYGSNYVQSVQIGDQVFYVSADGTKVRAMQYDFTTDNWLSRDITFSSEHLTSVGIKDMAWIQNPGNILWIVLEDGNFVVLVYERSFNIIGWARGETFGGLNDVASGELNGQSFAVALVSRVANKLYLETAAPVQYMDSWVDRSYPAGTTVVNGLEHLEGLTVQILTDGAVHPDRVVSGGEITLDWSANNVIVGLQFISEMSTLTSDMGSQRGTSRHAEKHWNKVYIELYNSALPIINGVRAPDRTPSTPMDTPEPVRTQIVQTVTLGRTKQGTINIKQDLPEPLNVVAIYGEMAQDSI